MLTSTLRFTYSLAFSLAFRIAVRASHSEIEKSGRTKLLSHINMESVSTSFCHTLHSRHDNKTQKIGMKIAITPFHHNIDPKPPNLP